MRSKYYFFLEEFKPSQVEKHTAVSSKNTTSVYMQRIIFSRFSCRIKSQKPSRIFRYNKYIQTYYNEVYQINTSSVDKKFTMIAHEVQRLWWQYPNRISLAVIGSSRITRFIYNFIRWSCFAAGFLRKGQLSSFISNGIIILWQDQCGEYFSHHSGN